MAQPHPIRRASLGTIIPYSNAPAIPESDFEATIATISAVGERMERLQAKIDEQAVFIANSNQEKALLEKREILIVSLNKEISDLKMHKDAAYSEMARSEAAYNVERERADRAEISCQEATKREHEVKAKLARMVATIKDRFGSDL